MLKHSITKYQLLDLFEGVEFSRAERSLFIFARKSGKRLCYSSIFLKLLAIVITESKKGLKAF